MVMFTWNPEIRLVVERERERGGGREGDEAREFWTISFECWQQKRLAFTEDPQRAEFARCALRTVFPQVRAFTLEESAVLRASIGPFFRRGRSLQFSLQVKYCSQSYS